jgi:cytosine/adenosine deaminase-related metal-dependent hydrolase
MAAHGYVDVDVVCLREGEFIMPGFCDTHTHAPQVPNMGRWVVAQQTRVGLIILQWSAI